jgi:phosphoenolpyruvate carboxylase
MSRFALQWLVPREPDRLTHVMLLDRERPAPYALAVGHGADNAQALLNLWQTLVETEALPQAIDYVAAAYTHRTGKPPAKSGN